MRPLVLVILVLVAAGPAGAMDIPFRDGSVIEAAGYTVTGSYLMVETADGSRVAYDIADIDLEALRAAEAEAAAAQAVEAAPETAATTLGVAGTLTVPDHDADAEGGGITITDQHVKHVSGSGIEGPEDEPAEDSAAVSGVPEGFQEGGGVLLNNVVVSPLEGGQWQVDGEVVNRGGDNVLDVQASLEIPVPDAPAMTTSVPVVGILGPDEKAAFSHTFSAPDGVDEGWTPQVRVSVIWKQGGIRLEPDYKGNAPHPSNLPLERGGVQGAETRNDEVID